VEVGHGLKIMERVCEYRYMYRYKCLSSVQQNLEFLGFLGFWGAKH
jgi:hypothetical protein